MRRRKRYRGRRKPSKEQSLGILQVLSTDTPAQAFAKLYDKIYDKEESSLFDEESVSEKLKRVYGRRNKPFVAEKNNAPIRALVHARKEALALPYLDQKIYFDFEEKEEGQELTTSGAVLLTSGASMSPKTTYDDFVDSYAYTVHPSTLLRPPVQSKDNVEEFLTHIFKPKYQEPSAFKMFIQESSSLFSDIGDFAREWLAHKGEAFMVWWRAATAKESPVFEEHPDPELSGAVPGSPVVGQSSPKLGEPS